MNRKKDQSDQSSKQKLQELEDKIQDLDNQLKRAVADYQNLQKRHQNSRHQIVKHANQSLLDKLLPILDDLKEAQDHLQDNGLSLIVDQFEQTLKSEGLTPIKAQGENFNPETMDCAEIVPGPENKVVNVLTPGFCFHDQVLRPAKVEVGSGPKQKDK